MIGNHASDNDLCEAPRCRKKGEIRFLGKWLCEEHFAKEEDRLEAEAKRVLGVDVND